MAVRFPPFPVKPIPPSRPSGRRSPRLVAAAALLLAASSCSVLPPSMRGKAHEAPPQAAQAPAGPQAQFGPAPAANVATAEAGSGKVEAKVFKGTGNFLNARSQPGATPPGPEEASLNFEALDVREVAKVILGDYLKQSYTVHPLVQGTVTTIKIFH